LDGFPANQVTLVCTGSQGEPTSALVRMGQQDPRSVGVVPGDTIIISATSIPGNEEVINRTLDSLFRLGANVFYDDVLDVHVSGHASQEEQKMMLNLVRPRYFVPIHGEYRHLVLHGKLAQQCGLQSDHIFIMETGDVLEIDAHGAEIVDHVTDSPVFVDGRGVGDIAESVIEERRALSRNGFVVIAVNLDKYTGGLMGDAQIVTRGFVYEAEAGDLLERARQEVARAVQSGGTRSEVTERVKGALTRFTFDETGRRPMIVAVINKV
jgi:ribonuclease J